MENLKTLSVEFISNNRKGISLFWTGNWLNTPIDLRKWAALKNGDFNKEMSNILTYYGSVVSLV